MVVRNGEKALVGWATTKSGDTAAATVVDGSQTSHSLQLAVRTEMRDRPAVYHFPMKVRFSDGFISLIYVVNTVHTNLVC